MPTPLFEKGNKLSTGRPSGSLNKRTENFLSVLEKKQFCPATALIEIYLEAKKVYDSYGVIFDAIVEAREQKGLFPVQDNAHQYLKIAESAASQLVQYSYPKLKAIDTQFETSDIEKELILEYRRRVSLQSKEKELLGDLQKKEGE